MKIKSVKCRMLAGTLDTPIQFGIGAFPTFSATLVEVTTDDGLVGIGECIVRRAPQVTRAVVDHMLAPVITGRDPHDVEGLWDEMFQQLRGWGHYRGFVFEALSGIDTATAMAVCRQLEPLEITWIEEPVPPDDLDGYQRVRAGQSIPVAAGESEFGVFGFRELIRRGAIDVVQPDVARVGGFTGARRVGALVHAHNLRYAPHTGFSAGVSHLASLHVAASVPNLMTYEYFFAPNPLRDLFTEPFPEPREGMIDVPQKPGLGLELDEKVLRRFEIS